MRRRMRNPCGLKVKRYMDGLIDLNEYLDLLPGEIMSSKIEVIELNEILINGMRNIWIKQAYLQGFDCKYINFNKSVNMFERMKILEYIYEGSIDPDYKKSTREDVTRAGHIRKKIRASAFPHNYSEMSERYGNPRKINVDHPKGDSKTCLIHGPGH